MALLHREAHPELYPEQSARASLAGTAATLIVASALGRYWRVNRLWPKASRSRTSRNAFRVT